MIKARGSFISAAPEKLRKAWNNSIFFTFDKNLGRIFCLSLRSCLWCFVISCSYLSANYTRWEIPVEIWYFQTKMMHGNSIESVCLDDDLYELTLRSAGWNSMRRDNKTFRIDPSPYCNRSTLTLLMLVNTGSLSEINQQYRTCYSDAIELAKLLSTWRKHSAFHWNNYHANQKWIRY